jgi:hypothetical protein
VKAFFNQLPNLPVPIHQRSKPNKEVWLLNQSKTVLNKKEGSIVKPHNQQQMPIQSQNQTRFNPSRSYATSGSNAYCLEINLNKVL